MKVAEYRGFWDQYSRARVASLEGRLHTEDGTVGAYGSLVMDASAGAIPSRRRASKSCASTS